MLESHFRRHLYFQLNNTQKQKSIAVSQIFLWLIELDFLPSRYPRDFGYKAIFLPKKIIFIFEERMSFEL